jgi:hypothetical protein
LLDDGEAEEDAMEQRALLVSFEMRCRGKAARHFMVAERRAAAERVAEAQATARATAHRRNIEVARSAAAVTEQRLTRRTEWGRMRRWWRRTIAAEPSTPSLPTIPSRSARMN